MCLSRGFHDPVENSSNQPILQNNLGLHIEGDDNIKYMATRGKDVSCPRPLLKQTFK